MKIKLLTRNLHKNGTKGPEIYKFKQRPQL